ARARARARGVACNRELRGAALERHAPLDAGSTARLRAMPDEGTLTIRGAQRGRALAPTLLDLDRGDGPLGVEHVEQALTLRCSARRGVLACAPFRTGRTWPRSPRSRGRAPAGWPGASSGQPPPRCA